MLLVQQRDEANVPSFQLVSCLASCSLRYWAVEEDMSDRLVRVSALALFGWTFSDPVEVMSHPDVVYLARLGRRVGHLGFCIWRLGLGCLRSVSLFSAPFPNIDCGSRVYNSRFLIGECDLWLDMVPVFTSQSLSLN